MSAGRATLRILLAPVLLSTACIRGGDAPATREVELGPVDSIGGLVGASADVRENPPQLVAGATPELSGDLERALRDSAEPVEALVRVLIAADGGAFGVKVLQTRPAGSELARQYGDEVAQAIWDWRFAAASRDGAPVRGYLDLSFRYGGQR